jgi:hypothetical protein
VTLHIIRLLYRFLVDRSTLEPRRGVFFVFYYLSGLWVVFMVASMVMVGLDLYNFPFVRDLVYRHIGEGVLSTLESLLF